MQAVSKRSLLVASAVLLALASGGAPATRKRPILASES